MYKTKNFVANIHELYKPSPRHDNRIPMKLQVVRFLCALQERPAQGPVDLEGAPVPI